MLTLRLTTALLSLPFTTLPCLSVTISDSDRSKHRLLSTGLGKGNADRQTDPMLDYWPLASDSFSLARVAWYLDGRSRCDRCPAGATQTQGIASV